MVIIPLPLCLCNAPHILSTHNVSIMGDGVYTAVTCVYVMFLRSADVPTRQRYVALVEGVKDGGGSVKVFSSLHVSGERKTSCISIGRETITYNG